MKFMHHSRKYCIPAVLLLQSLLLSLTLCGQDNGFTVKGRIYSAETGLPLGDIGIRAANSSVEPVNTSPEGEFEIILPDRNEQIYISYPGYKERTVFVNGRHEIDVWLPGEDEVSVGDKASMSFRDIALRDIPSAVDAGNFVEFNKSPESSFCQDLQGRVGGLNVVNRSGMPGEGAYLHTRGY